MWPALRLTGLAGPTISVLPPLRYLLAAASLAAFSVLSLWGMAADRSPISERSAKELMPQIAHHEPGSTRAQALSERVRAYRRALSELRIRFGARSLVPDAGDMRRLRTAFLKLDGAAREAGCRVGVSVEAWGPLGPERARGITDALLRLPAKRTQANPSTVLGGRRGSSEVSFSVALLDGPVRHGRPPGRSGPIGPPD